MSARSIPAPAAEPQQRPAADGSEAGAGEAFSGRVLTLFLAHVLTAGIGVINGFVLAAMIGPEGKGDYYLLTFLPTTLMVMIQLGLPGAFSFFTARGQTNGLILKTVALAGGLSAAATAAVIALPAVRTVFLDGLDPVLLLVALIALPLLLNATFTTAIVVGRQAVRWVAGINVTMTVSATVLIVVLVGVLGTGLNGALAAFVLTAVILAVGFLVAARRVVRSQRPTGATSYRELLSYGLPLYPGSLTQFFSTRIDVYLLAWLIADASAALGFYSMAVSMAELVFFLPNAVSTFFFPHVAASAREDADRQVPRVCRVTLLLTVGVAVALAPVATVMLSLLLPAFVSALPALYVLLPGVVALSLTKVLTGYVAGLGRSGLTSAIHVSAFLLNVLVNLVSIPAYGFVGAAAASLISYTASTIVFTLVASRLSGARVREFWLPQRGDVVFVVETSVSLARRLRGSARGLA